VLAAAGGWQLTLEFVAVLGLVAAAGAGPAPHRHAAGDKATVARPLGKARPADHR
jgi:hypothetical protein